MVPLKKNRDPNTFISLTQDMIDFIAKYEDSWKMVPDSYDYYPCIFQTINHDLIKDPYKYTPKDLEIIDQMFKNIINEIDTRVYKQPRAYFNRTFKLEFSPLDLNCKDSVHKYMTLLKKHHRVFHIDFSLVNIKSYQA